MATWEVIHGDCLDVLRGMAANSVDAIVTDPPYGLSFMGKRWDYDVPSVEVWAECLRVLKPGGHLLAFAGTRTQHRMAVRIEDAGFEIRDMIAWVYGSGFPKSLDVSKAIDKAAGAEREVLGVKDNSFGRKPGGGDGWGEAIEGGTTSAHTFNITAPATDLARQWSGWGTALKPAWESVTLATKPTSDSTELAIILSSLSRLEDELCQLSNANVAGSVSPSSQSASAEAFDTARCNAGDRTNTLGGSCDPTDTLPSGLATCTSLNIVRSWRRTLGVHLHETSTSTTATESSTTTDWRTLRYCLSQITARSIIRACSHPDGFSASADTAVAHFNASLALLQATRTLSATELAISLEAASCPVVDVRPNLDPCIMARKPFDTTVAANVQEWGTGAINVDGCRVGTEGGTARANTPGAMRRSGTSFECGSWGTSQLHAGRWPANLIHDGSDEVVGVFPKGAPARSARTAVRGGSSWHGRESLGSPDGMGTWPGDGGGSAARFFYCAKASKAERDAGLEGMEERACGMMEDDNYDIKTGSGNSRDTKRRNHHPTVKPAALMAYLCRLVTPPGGVVLDPFTGSGSTGIAAIREGFNFVGIEREAEYIEIARKRIAHEAANTLYQEVGK